MPVVTVPKLPSLAAPRIGNIEITTPAMTEERDDTKADDGFGAGDSSTAVEAAGNGNGGVAVTPEERERQVKLGLLLVRLGAANENSVFGPRGLMVPPPDLLVIHRPEDDVQPQGSFKWYNPLSWFFIGSRTSPMVWGLTAPPPANTREDALTPPATSMATAAATTETVTAPPTAKTKATRTRSLPVVNMQPLRDEESLEPAVREERARLQKDSDEVHRVLDGIEDTRYTYLVPSQEIRCEEEVVSVVRCYEKHNAMTRGQLFSGDMTSLTALPAVADVLQCGPVVALLKQCAEGMVVAYNKSDGSG